MSLLRSTTNRKPSASIRYSRGSPAAAVHCHSIVADSLPEKWKSPHEAPLIPLMMRRRSGPGTRMAAAPRVLARTAMAFVVRRFGVGFETIPHALILARAQGRDYVSGVVVSGS